MKALGVAAVVLAAAMVPLALVLRTAVDGGGTGQRAPRQVPATAVPTTTPTSAVVASRTERFMPRPEDFTAAVRPLSTTCGLSIRPAPELADQRIAHCRVTYRTLVSYHGRPLEPGVTYTVGYQVIGTVNGSESYVFTISGTHVRGLPMRTAVPSPGTSLAAVPNQVSRVP